MEELTDIKKEGNLPVVKVLNKDGSIKEVREVTKDYVLGENEKYTTDVEWIKDQHKFLKIGIEKTADAIKIEEKKDKKNIDIWLDIINKTTGEVTGQKLIHKNVAAVLIEDFNFITIGETRLDILYYKDGQYIKGGDLLIANEVQKMTENRVKNYDILEVIGQIKRRTYKDRSVLTQTPKEMMCVNNGILNIITLKLIPHNPELIFTQKIPHDFKPGEDCKKIKTFLGELLKEDDLKTVQEYTGYLLWREDIFKKAVICVGEKDTGKTTFNKLIVNFVGEQNTSGESLHRIISDKFSAENLYNKLLNIYDDLSFKDIDDTGAFKIITGNGWVSGEKKFGDRFRFRNYAKLMFNTNKISSVEDSDDEAYFGRWIILFFNNVFNGENVKHNVIEDITTPKEMAGFLNWGLIGLKRLFDNNGFSYPYTAEDNKRMMEKDSSSISAFAQDFLIVQPTAWISKEDLYNVYSEYVNMFGGARVTKEKFGRDLPKKEKFIIEGRMDTTIKKSITGWLNIGFTTNKAFNTFLQVISIKNKIKYIPKIIKHFTYYYSRHMIIEKALKALLFYKGGKLIPDEEQKKQLIQKDITQNIMEIINHLSDKLNTIPLENILKTARNAHISEEKVEEAIEHLKREGIVFEPKNGFIKKL